jgi:hypothetical protein
MTAAHPSMNAAVAARREREFERARSAADVDRLQRKWANEDAAIAEAADWRTREVAELRARDAALEGLLGHHGKRLIDPIISAVADAM